MDYLKDYLTQIGFSEYEAKVYLALLHESPGTGYQLSKKSGVPRSMVYEALGRLAAAVPCLKQLRARYPLSSPTSKRTVRSLRRRSTTYDGWAADRNGKDLPKF